MSDNNEKPPKKSRKVTPASEITGAFDPQRGSENDGKNVQEATHAAKKEAFSDIDHDSLTNRIRETTSVLSNVEVNQICNGFVYCILDLPVNRDSIEADSIFNVMVKDKEITRGDSGQFWRLVNGLLGRILSERELEFLVSTSAAPEFESPMNLLSLLPNSPVLLKLRDNIAAARLKFFSMSKKNV